MGEEQNRGFSPGGSLSKELKGKTPHGVTGGKKKKKKKASKKAKTVNLLVQKEVVSEVEEACTEVVRDIPDSTSGRFWAKSPRTKESTEKGGESNEGGVVGTKDKEEIKKEVVMLTPAGKVEALRGNEKEVKGPETQGSIVDVLNNVSQVLADFIEKSQKCCTERSVLHSETQHRKEGVDGVEGGVEEDKEEREDAREVISSEPEGSDDDDERWTCFTNREIEHSWKEFEEVTDGGLGCSNLLKGIMKSLLNRTYREYRLGKRKMKKRTVGLQTDGEFYSDPKVDVIEDKLEKLLTQEEIYELVNLKWRDKHFKQLKKMEVLDGEAENVVVFHDINKDGNKFLEGKSRLMEKECLVECQSQC